MNRSGFFYSTEPLMTIVELGTGDGRLLKKLIEIERIKICDGVTKVGNIYVGIELDDSNYNKAKSTLQGFTNVLMIKGSFEVLINAFSDGSIDEIISVLPDPDFIDIEKQYRWQNFYKVMNRKMSGRGMFRLVTELIDDLLQPVPEDAYKSWVHRVVDTFKNLGFSLLQMSEGSPEGYESECLERFISDPERIRIATFDFMKRR